MLGRQINLCCRYIAKAVTWRSELPWAPVTRSMRVWRNRQTRSVQGAVSAMICEFKSHHSHQQCSDGETGRRAALRALCPQGRRGSTPLLSTNYLTPRRSRNRLIRLVNSGDKLARRWTEKNGSLSRCVASSEAITKLGELVEPKIVRQDFWVKLYGDCLV